jgi:hypothetical protein
VEQKNGTWHNEARRFYEAEFESLILYICVFSLQVKPPLKKLNNFFLKLKFSEKATKI